MLLPDMHMTTYAIALLFMAFTMRRLLVYLQFFQQEEYDNKRFLRWLWDRRIVDVRFSVVLLGAMGGMMVYPTLLWWLVVALGLMVLTVLMMNPFKTGKKKLVFTTRAKRIYYGAAGLMVLAVMGVVMLPADLWPWLVATHIIPLALVGSNLLLNLFEQRLQKRYWQEAHTKVQHLQPFVIGVTGSFGKTSVKHMLGHVLQMHAPTLWTPGSVNTPMGNTRFIRENLRSYHKYFVVEMGAYGQGSIGRLCALTPPDMAIVTAVGPAHYERFKTLDAVAETKFELPRAAVAKNLANMVITHEHVLAFAAVQDFQQAHPETLSVVGYGTGCELQILDVTQKPEGLDVKVHWGTRSWVLQAPLYGQHHARNLAMVFLAACKLGMKPQQVVAALKTVPQIQHRLQVLPQADGSVLIDDAFNSNPQGFVHAMELMDMLAKHHGGRRILVTPGMVELGARHDEDHRQVAARAAAMTDVVLAVCPRRMPTFVETYQQQKEDQQILELCPTFAAAQAWLQANVRKGDVVLLENDLPDLYETRLIL